MFKPRASCELVNSKTRPLYAKVTITISSAAPLCLNAQTISPELPTGGRITILHDWEEACMHARLLTWCAAA